MDRALICSTLTVITLLLASCSNLSGRQAPTNIAAATLSAEVMGKWARSCALCHVSGEAGAPVIGDVVAWQPRLVKGEQAVLQNVLTGVNFMPPLGYCMGCEVEDFRAMIRYMSGAMQ